MKVRANAETPADARMARSFGAEGIGLCRTEHMFFEGDRIVAMREMILADNEKDRRAALAKLLPMQRSDFVELFEIMAGLPVTIRLLDPPLHEFLPKTEEEIAEVAAAMNVSAEKLRQRTEALHEFNPMLGHRGCRLADLLSGDRRDAGARHLRGRGRGGQEDRRAGRAGDHGAAGRPEEGARLRQGAHRRGGARASCEETGVDGRLSRRHDDRAAARRHPRP